MGLLQRLFTVARSQLSGGIRRERLPRGRRSGIDHDPVGHDAPCDAAPRSDRRADRPDPAPQPDPVEVEYYANLELQPGARYDEIRSAYRRLLLLYHPDMHNEDLEKAEIAATISKRLNEAMEHFERKHQGGQL